MGIGAAVLLETYIVGTILVGWEQELNDAIARDDIVWILNNNARIIRYWYSASATYHFSIVCKSIIIKGLTGSGLLNLELHGFYVVCHITFHSMNDGKMCFSGILWCHLYVS